MNFYDFDGESNQVKRFNQDHDGITGESQICTNWNAPDFNVSSYSLTVRNKIFSSSTMPEWTLAKFSTV